LKENLPSDVVSDVFSQYVVILLNSVFVEEFLGGKDFDDKKNMAISYNNPISVPAIFLTNMDSLSKYLTPSILSFDKKLASSFPLFELFASCPLFSCFLDDITYKTLKNVPGLQDKYTYTGNTIFLELSKIKIKSAIAVKKLPKFSGASRAYQATLDQLNNIGITAKDVYSWDFLDFKMKAQDAFLDKKIDKGSWKALRARITENTLV
jgi:hypothetical protein